MKRSTSSFGPLVSDFDQIEFYVGNAQHAAYFFQTAFGLKLVEQAGLTTGCRDTNSLMLAEGSMRLVFSSDLGQGAVAEHVHRHGDGVKDIGLLVRDADAAFERAVRHGAKPIQEPQEYSVRGHTMRKGVVGGPGDLVHSLIERDGSVPAFLPNGEVVAGTWTDGSLGFQGLDHVALAVDQGELERWVEFYKSAFDFEVTHEEITSTAFSAMRSMVVENATRTVKFPIMEPAEGKKRSQIEDFLQFHSGSGVQHLAFLCDDIGRAVRALRSRSVEFLRVPDGYYEMLPSRFDHMDEHFSAVREWRVLIDRDESGILLQTFSKPVTGRPTLFIELVQRMGATGFGRGNIRALFEAVEREQAARW